MQREFHQGVETNSYSAHTLYTHWLVASTLQTFFAPKVDANSGFSNLFPHLWDIAAKCSKVDANVTQLVQYWCDAHRWWSLCAYLMDASDADRVLYYYAIAQLLFICMWILLLWCVNTLFIVLSCFGILYLTAVSQIANSFFAFDASPQLVLANC